MPSQILHCLFGEDTLRAAARVISSSATRESFLSGVLGGSGGAFRLGCQGPDLFYHNQRTRPLGIEYGTLLHRRSFGDFAAALMRRCLARKRPDKPDQAAAYAWGFVTHAYLDRYAHPYIVYKAGWVSPRKPETVRFARAHAFFERILDVLMLELLRSQAAASWDQAELLAKACQNEAAVLGPILADSLRERFPERAGVDRWLDRRIANAFKDAHYFYTLTNPIKTSFKAGRPNRIDAVSSFSGPASVALLYPERFPLSVDYLNLGEKPWDDPRPGVQKTDLSFPTLYFSAMEAAIKDLRLLIGAAMDGVVPQNAGALLGNGGLSIVDDEGRPTVPEDASPFDLDMILAEQYRLRRERALRLEL